MPKLLPLPVQDAEDSFLLKGSSAQVGTCAGRVAEELIYGADEVSTINQRRLVLARRIVTKLVAAAAMTDAPAIGPRTLTVPYFKGDKTLIQIFPRRVRPCGP